MPSFRDLPNPGIEPRSPGLQADSLLTEPNICTNNIYTIHTHTYIYRHSLYICVYAYLYIYIQTYIYIHYYIYTYILTHFFLHCSLLQNIKYGTLVIHSRIVFISLSETPNPSLSNLPTFGNLKSILHVYESVSLV